MAPEVCAKKRQPVCRKVPQHSLQGQSDATLVGTGGLLWALPGKIFWVPKTKSGFPIPALDVCTEGERRLGSSHPESEGAQTCCSVLTEHCPA